RHRSAATLHNAGLCPGLTAETGCRPIGRPHVLRRLPGDEIDGELCAKGQAVVEPSAGPPRELLPVSLGASFFSFRRGPILRTGSYVVAPVEISVSRVGVTN